MFGITLTAAYPIPRFSFGTESASMASRAGWYIRARFEITIPIRTNRQSGANM